MSIDYARTDELTSREDFGFGPSLNKQGRVACGGLKEPDYGTAVWADLRPCPQCGAQYPHAQLGCQGGTFHCWERRRRSERPHADYHCRACGYVWTTGCPR